MIQKIDYKLNYIELVSGVLFTTITLLELLGDHHNIISASLFGLAAFFSFDKFLLHQSKGVMRLTPTEIIFTNSGYRSVENLVLKKISKVAFKPKRYIILLNDGSRKEIPKYKLKSIDQKTFEQYLNFHCIPLVSSLATEHNKELDHL